MAFGTGDTASESADVRIEWRWGSARRLGLGLSLSCQRFLGAQRGRERLGSRTHNVTWVSHPPLQARGELEKQQEREAGGEDTAGSCRVIPGARGRPAWSHMWTQPSQVIPRERARHQLDLPQS